MVFADKYLRSFFKGVSFLLEYLRSRISAWWLDHEKRGLILRVALGNFFILFFFTFTLVKHFSSLKHFWLGTLFLLVFGAVGVALGKRFSGWKYRTLLATLVGSGIACLFWDTLGSQARLIGIYSVLNASFVSLILFQAGEKRLAQKRWLLRGALGVKFSPEDFDAIQSKPDSFKPNPDNYIVTVMFVEIVGFSSTVESLNPKDAFGLLREIKLTLSGIIHEYGGMVERYSEDGLLAIFGYHPEGVKKRGAHTDQALLSAIKIQQTMVKQTLQQVGSEKPVFPLRIGIDTLGVYIGDLGASESIELALIGTGVRFSKMLAGVCENNYILLGSTSKDMLVGAQTANINLTQKTIQAPEMPEGLEAYEFDPFASDAELKRKAEDVYRSYIGAYRVERRWPVPDEIPVEVFSTIANGVLINFSKAGLGVKMESYFGRGFTLDLSLGGRTSELHQKLQTLGLVPLLCEVRWGLPTSDGMYIHGLLLKNIDEKQKELLHQELRSLLSKLIRETAA